MDMDKLKEKILEERITRGELASKLGISLKTLNAKLNIRSCITVREAEKMTKILKIDNPSDIFFTSKSHICNKER